MMNENKWRNADGCPQEDAEKYYEANGEYPSYLVMLEDGIVPTIGQFNGSGWEFDGAENYIVTHWMPMPQPPKYEEVCEDDNVSHPSHYTRGGIECIDALTAMVAPMPNPVNATLSWQIVKYIWRHPFKNNPKEDLLKARCYLDRLISCVEKENDNNV